MKKILYYSLLAILLIVIIEFFAIVLIIVGLSPMYSSFGSTLGGATASPYIWIIAFGIVLLLRKSIYFLIMRENKTFDKAFAIVLIVTGFLWLLMIIAAKMMNDYTTNKLITTSYSQNIKSSLSVNDSYVYVCTGGSAIRYHSYIDCPGLSRCRGKKIKILRSAASAKGRTPCRKCYK